MPKKRRQTKRDESEATFYSVQTKEGRFECYRGDNNEFRWRLRANNGRVICCSSEGYERYAGAIRGAVRAKKIFAVLAKRLCV